MVVFFNCCCCCCCCWCCCCCLSETPCMIVIYQQFCSLIVFLLYQIFVSSRFLFLRIKFKFPKERSSQPPLPFLKLLQKPPKDSSLLLSADLLPFFSHKYKIQIKIQMQIQNTFSPITEITSKASQRLKFTTFYRCHLLYSYKYKIQIKKYECRYKIHSLPLLKFLQKPPTD